MASVPTGLSIRADQIQLLDAAAAAFGVSRSRIVQWLIDDATGKPSSELLPSIRAFLIRIGRDGLRSA